MSTGTSSVAMNNRNRISKSRVEDISEWRRIMAKRFADALRFVSIKERDQRLDRELKALATERDAQIEAIRKKYQALEGESRAAHESDMTEIGENVFKHWSPFLALASDTSRNSSGSRSLSTESSSAIGPPAEESQSNREKINVLTPAAVKHDQAARGGPAPVANMVAHLLPSPAASVAGEDTIRVGTPSGDPKNHAKRMRYPKQNELWTLVRRQLGNLKKMKIAEPFFYPVDAQEYPDYYDKVQAPMDLSTLTANVNAGKYTTLQGFEADFDLIIAAARRYNGQDSAMANDALSMKIRLNEGLKKAMSSEDRDKIKTKSSTLTEMAKAGLEQLDSEDDGISEVDESCDDELS